MARTAATVIAIAEAEVGYLEKKSNADLDSKTANAGSNNYTKYARDLDAIPGFYNGKKQGFPWCDCWTDWLFVQAFGVEAAKEMLCQPSNSLGAGCGYSANYYKNKGQFHKSNPKPGDQIFFLDSVGDVAHTGIVYKVDSTHVYTIEGNTSSASGVIANGGGVFKKSYKLNYSRIYGYGRPAYDEAEEPAEEKEEVCSVNIKVLKKGARGAEVKALQILLIGYGFSCGSYGADGDFGSATDKAVRAYQKAKGLSVDGICGPMTWSKLLGVS